MRALAWGEFRMIEFGGAAKTRPGLILTRDMLLSVVNVVTVAPVTRTLRGIPTQLPVGIEEGLKGPSAVALDGLQTVRKEQIGRYLGVLSPERREALRTALLFSLGLDR